MSQEPAAAPQAPDTPAARPVSPSTVRPPYRQAWLACPAGRAARMAVVDELYDDYRRQCAAGTAPPPEEYLERHAEYRSSLGRLLRTEQFFDINPELIEGMPEEWPSLGQCFLGFRLQRELGRGAFARVFLAEEPALGNRQVAVKVSQLGGPEAHTLGRLRHSNVVPVHSVQTDPLTGLTAICMPYLGGATLHHLLDHVYCRPDRRARAASILEAVTAAAVPEDAGLDLPEPAAALRRGYYADGVLHLAIQLADALTFIHGRGVLHGDLKPSNVLLTPDGRPMLLDFNLAVTPQANDPGVGGTLPYMAPEQLRAFAAPHGEPAAGVDARAEVFALGVLLYEMLAGQHPFGPIPVGLSHQALLAFMQERVARGFRPLRTAERRVGKGLARLVERCLAADPDRRPESAAAVATELRRLRERQRRARFGMVGLMVLALAAVTAVGYAIGRDTSDRQFRRGRDAFHEGRFDQAVAELSRVLDKDADPATFLLRGRAYQQLGRMDKAGDDFQHAQDNTADPRLIGQIFAARGFALQDRRSDHLTAQFCYTEAVNNGFANAAVYNNRGYAHVMRGEEKQALLDFDQALRLDQGLRVAYFNRAFAHAQLAGEDNEYVPLGGIDAIRQALALGPPNARLHFQAAALYGFVTQRKNPTLAETAIGHVRDAINLGQSPMSMSGIGKACPLIGRNPVFQQLMALPEPPNLPEDLPNIIDPLAGVAP